MVVKNKEALGLAIAAGVITYFLCVSIFRPVFVSQKTYFVPILSIFISYLTAIIIYLWLSEEGEAKGNRVLELFMKVSIMTLSVAMLLIGINTVQLKDKSVSSELEKGTKEFINTDFILRYQEGLDTQHLGIVDVREITILGVHKRVLFVPPPATISSTIKIDIKSRLRFNIALTPDAWKIGAGDGVQFDVLIRDQRSEQVVFSKYIDPKNISYFQGWNEYEVDLASWAGQDVVMSFVTSSGPNEDDRFDWAVWGEPVIVQPLAYSFMDHFDDASQLQIGTEEINIRRSELRIEADNRSIIFQHPSSRLVYSTELPLQSSINFGIGIDPSVWSPEKGDGVEYNIYIRALNNPDTLYRAYHRYIDPKNNPSERTWFDEEVDISQFGNQEVEIIFETLPGPNGNIDFDWSGWSEPVLIDRTGLQ